MDQAKSLIILHSFIQGLTATFQQAYEKQIEEMQQKLAQNPAHHGAQNYLKQNEAGFSPKRKKNSSKNTPRKKSRHDEIEFDE